MKMDNSDSERTVWCGNLSNKVSEEILYELFLQAAPLEKVKIPVDKDGKQCNYAFVTFKHAVSVQYAVELLNGIALFERNIIIKPRNNQQHQTQNVSHYAPKGLQSLKEVNMLVLGGQACANQMYIGMRGKYSPMSRSDRNYSNHKDERRNDKPYGQNFRNRNHRYDNDHGVNRVSHQNTYYGGRRNRH